MESVLQARGLGISAIYAHNDEMALGAIQAVRGAGLRPGQDITVVSIDGQRLALEAIVRGELGASVESNPRFGPLAFATLARFRAGEPIPARVLLEDRMFDRGNAASFLSQAY
jgi:ribose transport system substrate-binding protein